MVLTHSGRVSARELKANRKKIRRELAADTRRRVRARLAELRQKIRDLRGARKERIAFVREMYRSLRLEERERTRAKREELRRQRAELASKSREERARLVAEYREKRAAIPRELAEERAELERQIRELKEGARDDRRLDAAIAEMERDTRTPAERRAEAEDEVRANLPAELLPVWEKVKGKIRATRRTTLTEAFLHWVHDHSADVAEIIDSEGAASLKGMLAEEAAIAREYARWKKTGGKPSARLRELLEQSGELAPDSSSSSSSSSADDEWGGF